MKKNLFVSLLFFAMAAACNRLEAPASSHINGYEYIAKDQSIVKNSDGSVSGTGTIIFRKQISSSDSTNRFMLKFSLDDKGRLETVLKSTEKLDNGISLDFKREKSELLTTIGFVSNNRRFDVTTYLDQSEIKDESSEFEFVIDLISLKKNGLRMLIWEPNFKNTKPSFDSQEHMHLEDVIWGPFWGLILDHAKIYSVFSESLPEKAPEKTNVPL